MHDDVAAILYAIESRSLLLKKLYPVGPLDKPHPASQTAQQDEANKAALGFVVSRGDPALLLQVPKPPLPTLAKPLRTAATSLDA
jgi:hypothetical protein